jgi:DNA repair photolyase
MNADKNSDGLRYIANPPNPWHAQSSEWLGEPPPAKLQIYEETATKHIITKNSSPDVGFDYTVNVYRGCTHACNYCFARPYHEYLDFGAGTDFETKIVVKVNAPELLMRDIKANRHKGDRIMFSFASDAYQPLEGVYKLTRACLEVCLKMNQPVGILTKGPLITRDLDILVPMSEKGLLAGIFMTIPFVDAKLSLAFEPHVALPNSRFRALKKLTDAGIRTGVAVAPIIPGVNANQIPLVLQAAREAGAEWAFMNYLRLPGSVAPYFVETTRRRLPLMADKIINKVKRERHGKLNNPNFFERMKGTTEEYHAAVKLFNVWHKRLGFHERTSADRSMMSDESLFKEPTPSEQLSLFDR